MDNLETLVLSELQDLLIQHNLEPTGTRVILIQRLREREVTNNEDSDFDELPTDMTKIILSNLDDRELLRLCSVDRKVKLICSDDVFWKDRLTDNFPKFNIEKYDATTYRKLYEIISRNLDHVFELVKRITMHDSINMLTTVMSGLPEPDIDSLYLYALSIATENGKRNLVKYIFENNWEYLAHNRDVFYKLDLTKSAVSSGNIGIITCMIEYDICNIITAIGAVSKSPKLPESIVVLKYLFSIADPNSPKFNSDLDPRSMLEHIMRNSTKSVKKYGSKFKERIKVIIDGVGTTGIGNVHTIILFLTETSCLNDQDIFDYIVKAQKTYPQFRLDS